MSARVERNRAVATMREMGATLAETGQHFGITLQRVQQILRRPEVQDIVNPTVIHVDVPDWVRKWDLVEDFEDVAREYGEEKAASHCRKLIKELDPTP